MNPVLAPPDPAWPDHTQLPAMDGRSSDDSRLRPQGALLVGSLQPVLKRLHPDNLYLIGVKVGIHWRECGEPPRYCKWPDWFYVPGVSPMLEGRCRRSYDLWRERVPPQVVLEFVSGDGAEEHDATPETGKFWVYKQAIRAAYYGIFDSERLLLEVYELVQGRYQRMAPNACGRFFLPPLGVELGIWHGDYSNMTLPWLRWWHTQGNLLPASQETAEAERQAKEQAERRAEAERQAKEQAERRAEQSRQETEAAVEQAKRLADKLRALGIDPEA